MLKFNPFHDDPGDSIPINFGLSLKNDFSPLIAWLSGEVFRSAFDFPNRPLPRPTTMTQVHASLDCLLANLLHASNIRRNCYLAVPMGAGRFTRSRYHRRNIGLRNFQRVIRTLREAEPPYVEFIRGFNDRRTGVGRNTRIRPTARLLRILDGFVEIVETDVRQLHGRNMDDVIAELIDHQRQPPPPMTIDKALIREAVSDVIVLRDDNKNDVEYEDNDLTNGMRQRLERWNDFISSFHIDILVPDEELLQVMNRRSADDEFEDEVFFGDRQNDARFVDFRRTRLHRVFNNGSFDQGGRFYGGWWQGVPSRYRRYITINNRPIVEIDYSALHPMMLYARAGLSFPEEPYEIEGIGPDYRPLIKTTFLKLVNALPGQRIRPPYKDQLPEGWTWQQLQDVIREKHVPIKDYLGSGVGMELQCIDSEIAERVMMQTQTLGLPVLPVHDSFLTYAGLMPKLRGIMHDAYRESMKADIKKTKIEPSHFDKIWVEVRPLHEQPNAIDEIEKTRRIPAYGGYWERWTEFETSHPQAGEQPHWMSLRPVRREHDPHLA